MEIKLTYENDDGRRELPARGTCGTNISVELSDEKYSLCGGMEKNFQKKCIGDPQLLNSLLGSRFLMSHCRLGVPAIDDQQSFRAGGGKKFTTIPNI